MFIDDVCVDFEMLVFELLFRGLVVLKFGLYLCG